MVAGEVKELTFGFFKVLEDTVTHFGVWLSLAVLLLEAVKLLIMITMIGVTLMKEGLVGCHAIKLQLFCSELVMTKIALERGKKERSQK